MNIINLDLIFDSLVVFLLQDKRPRDKSDLHVIQYIHISNGSI